MAKALTSGKAALGELYERLPNLDFSRDVLEGAEDTLRVLAVPGCGWSDLGTPQRVVECVRRCEETALPGRCASHEFSRHRRVGSPAPFVVLNRAASSDPRVASPAL